VFFREDELIKHVFIWIINALAYCHNVVSIIGISAWKTSSCLYILHNGHIDVSVTDFGLATTSMMMISSCETLCSMSPELLVPQHHSHSTAQGDVRALGCILAEMIGKVQPWSLATPEDSEYSESLMDCTVLFDMLPVPRAAYLHLLRKILSTKSE